MGSKIILVVGATGLVGSTFIKQVLRDPNIHEVRCLVRTPLNDIEHSKIKYITVSFFDLDQNKEIFNGVTDVICCVGTTIKKAKSREGFQMVDHYIPKTLARLAKDAGVGSFQIVTSVGANANSSSFYLRVKGVVEDTVRRFDFNRLLIYRPSLLDGDRQEFRLGESVMKVVFKLFFWVIPKAYWPTRVDLLAEAMLRDLHSADNGVHIIESTMIN